MRLSAKWAAVLLSQFAALSAMAAGPSGLTSITGIVGTVAPLATSLPLPEVGTLGAASLSAVTKALPGLNTLTVPGVGYGLGTIPVLSQVTVSEGLNIVQAIGPLQGTLPGLEFLSVNPAIPLNSLHLSQ